MLENKFMCNRSGNIEINHSQTDYMVYSHFPAQIIRAPLKLSCTFTTLDYEFIPENSFADLCCGNNRA